MESNKVQSFTFFTKDGKTFQRYVASPDGNFPHSEEVHEDVEINSDQIKLQSELARSLFNRRFAEEAARIGEGKPERILEIMWNKTKLEGRKECELEARQLMPVQPRKFVRYTEKGHSIYIEVGTVFVPIEKAGELPLNKPVDEAWDTRNGSGSMIHPWVPSNTKLTGDDYVFKSSDYRHSAKRPQHRAMTSAERMSLQPQTSEERAAIRNQRVSKVLSDFANEDVYTE